MRCSQVKANCNLCAVFVLFCVHQLERCATLFSYAAHSDSHTGAQTHTHTHVPHTYGNMHICKYVCANAYKAFVGAKLKQQLKTLTNQCHRALRY